MSFKWDVDSNRQTLCNLGGRLTTTDTHVIFEVDYNRRTICHLDGRMTTIGGHLSLRRETGSRRSNCRDGQCQMGG